MLIVAVGVIGSAALSLVIWRCIFEIASNDISAFTIIPCYLGALISISPVVILPLDITSSLLGQKNEYFFTLIKIFWKVTYFILFILCWLIFPILLEYELSGDFDHNKKLRASFERNKNRWITQIIVISILSILYLTVFNLRNSKFSISSMCIAVAHFWGMAQITFLWGYGLVAIPSKIKNTCRLLDKGEMVRKLNKYYIILHNLEDLMAINHHELKILNDKLKYLYSISEEECKKNTLGKMIKVINESRSALIRTNEYFGEILSLNNINSKHSFEKEITMEDLITFNRELKLLIAEEKRIYYLWESTLSSSWKLENLIINEQCFCIESENSPLIFSSIITLPMQIFSINKNDLRNNNRVFIENNLIKSHEVVGIIDNTFSKSSLVKIIELIKYIGHYFVKKITSINDNHLNNFVYTSSLITSIGIIIAEATMYFPNLNVSLYSHLIRICSQIKYLNDRIRFILLYFICQILLIYVYVCTYWGLFHFKIPKKYGIYFNNHTDGPCIVFFSQFLCKLSTALCFHYLSILKTEETEFGKFYGKQIQHLNIFGKDFNVFFFPVVVVLVYAINIFDLQGKLIRSSGIYYIFFEHYIFDDGVIGPNTETESTWNEKISNGKRISEVQKTKKTMQLHQHQEMCECINCTKTPF